MFSDHAVCPAAFAERVVLHIELLRIHSFPPFSFAVGSGQDPVIRDSHLVPIAVITSGRLIPCPGMVCVQADPERKTMLAGCRSPFGENVSFRTDIYRIPRLVFAVPEVEVVMMVAQHKEILRTNTFVNCHKTVRIPLFSLEKRQYILETDFRRVPPIT